MLLVLLLVLVVVLVLCLEISSQSKRQTAYIPATKVWLCGRRPQIPNHAMTGPPNCVEGSPIEPLPRVAQEYALSAAVIITWAAEVPSSGGGGNGSVTTGRLITRKVIYGDLIESSVL